MVEISTLGGAIAGGVIFFVIIFICWAVRRNNSRVRNLAQAQPQQSAPPPNPPPPNPHPQWSHPNAFGHQRPPQQPPPPNHHTVSDLSHEQYQQHPQVPPPPQQPAPAQPQYPHQNPNWSTQYQSSVPAGGQTHEAHMYNQYAPQPPPAAYQPPPNGAYAPPPPSSVPPSAPPSAPPLSEHSHNVTHTDERSDAFNPDELLSFDATGEDKNANCPICFDPLSAEKCSTGQCLHVIHTDCLKKWLMKDKITACPVCRVPYADASYPPVLGQAV